MCRLSTLRRKCNFRPNTEGYSSSDGWPSLVFFTPLWSSLRFLIFSLLALPIFCLITIFHTYMQTLHFELRGDEEDFIQLIQLLKATNLVYNGAEAQEVVAAGMVLRNGVVETRKRAKIVRGDVIEYEGNRIEVI